MKIYEYNGVVVSRGECPDPFQGSSPMTDARFIALGGTITEDGQLSPKEAVISSLNTMLHAIASQVEGVTIAEFKQAAKTMISSDLIEYARIKQIDESIIKQARERFVEIMADALRVGLSWDGLIDGITTE